MDFPTLLQSGAISLSVFVAGAGVYRMTHAGARFFERSEAKAIQVADMFLDTQVKIAAAQDRQAAALETGANLTALLERIHEDQRQTSGTLRVFARKLEDMRIAQNNLQNGVYRLQTAAGLSLMDPEGGPDDSTAPIEPQT